MKYLLLIFLSILIILSCDLSDPEDVDKAEIEEILQDIEFAFTYEDEIAIMSFYHP